MSSSSAAAFNRSLTRVLRGKGIDERIQCTSTLVASYNAEEDPKGREALKKWLEAYFDEFSQLRTGSIPRKAIAEFVNLAAIEVREPADAELVRRVYTTLQEVVMTKEGCSVYSVLALEHILSTIDKEILQGDARTLISLADRLLEMTDPKKMPLTRDTFEYHASCLNAFERVLMVLHDLEKDRSNNQIVKYFEDETKKHLDMIISCQCYYPFAYQALLIKEHLNALLTRDIKSNLINAGRRAFHAFCGGLYIFQGVRELAVMKLDFNVMVSGLEKIQQAFKNIGWNLLPGIQEIVLAASETVEYDDFGIFQQCFDKHKEVSWLEGLKWSKQRAIRYALVSHLCLFSTKEHSRSIQTLALELVVKLVTEDEGKQWRDDKHIFEAMIDSLVAIGNHNQEHEGKVINAFNTISNSQTKQHKKILDECLNGTRFEAKTRCAHIPQEDDANRSLYDSTRQRLNLYTTAHVYNRDLQILKDCYTTDSFAKVSLFSDKTDQRHIETFDFNLEQYEKVVVSQDRIGQSSQDNSNQRENNHQRTTMVRKPINMKDLFKDYGNPAHGFQEVAQRILVIGNPGTGKTSLTKRLCYDWANGSWGTQFTHVYLLPIRRLHESSFGKDVDLPLIIRHLLYKTSGAQDSKNALYNEIKDKLSEPSTLLTLDGYDEAGEMAMELVSSAFTQNCSLLILSRPHSVQDIRPKVDIEVECLQLKENQLESLVRNELDLSNANELIEFFSRNLSIKDTCRVAVNAQVITRLWKSSYKEKLIKSSCANLAWFYSMVSNYIWTRFRDKEDRFDMNKTFDSLELVAFESFKEGMVEIPQELVRDHAPDTQNIFRDSGFLLFMEEGSVFQFAHLTFHEYFVGRCLAKMMKSTNDETRQEAKDFIIEHRYIETSRVMLSFTTQCFCTRKATGRNLGAFEDLMQVFDKDPVPAISLQHLFLRMRMLDAFLPCALEEEEVHTNDVVMQIVNDAMDALKRWFGYEMGREKGDTVLMWDEYLQTPIIDELARMPNLFNRFPNLLKPILLNNYAMDEDEYLYRRDAARIGRLNPQYALQCIFPMLDNAPDEEQANMIEVCALIGPICAEPALDHLKRLCRDQDPDTRRMATTPLVAFIDLFPEREDVRQLMVDASRDQDEDVRNALMYSIREATFMQDTEVGAFVWDLLIEAVKDDHAYVRRLALESCVQHYQTFAKSVDEVVEIVREFVVSSNVDDQKSATHVIYHLIQKAPEKSEELLVLVKALCRDPDFDLRYFAVKSFQNIARSSLLTREDLFNVAFDLFKDGYPNVQLELLPFLFSFDNEENRGIDQVNEWIANCQDLDEEVRAKANSCSVANALLSKYTIEEIHDRFYDQDKEVQVEIIRQLDMREVESSKGADAIAKMAAHCLHYFDPYESSKSLLEKLSKTELFPNTVLEKLSKGHGWMAECVRRQPLSHLLEYYWNTKDSNMIPFFAQKLLFSPVIFEKKGETDMAVTLREKGANVKQTAPVNVVQDFLSLCKDFLKELYGLDFFSA